MYIENKEVMSKNLQYYMELNEKTRRDICNDLGFAYSTFTDWVKGNKYPRIDKIEMLANYFHISKADLVEDRTTRRQQARHDAIILNKLRQLSDEDKYVVESLIDTLLTRIQ